MDSLLYRTMTRLLFILWLFCCANIGFAQDKAEIKFDKKNYNFGELTSENMVSTCIFTFTNVGKAPLIIHQALASCGCTVPSFTREPIAPGEKGEIKITYNARGFLGHFKKVVTVRSNAKTSMTRLSIEGDVVKNKKNKK